MESAMKSHEDREAVLKIIQSMHLGDRNKEFRIKEEVDRIMPLLKEKGIEPSSKALQDGLENTKSVLKNIMPSRANEVSQLQEELKKRKLE